MIKKTIIIVFFTVSIILYNRIAICQEDNKELDFTPSLSFQNPDYDFGKIFRGEKIEHIYKFKNKGKGELKINDVKTSCGCTAAIISSKIIPNNGHGEIKVTFKATSSTKKVSKYIKIFSNDPDHPTYKLTISGNVIEEVVIDPRQLNFSEFLYGNATTKSITVKSITDPKFKISKVVSNRPDVITRLKKDKKKNEYIVEVTLKNDTKQGRINGKILIHTNSKNMKEVTVPFFGRVMGDVSVYPPRISCGVVAEKEEKTVPIFATAHNKDVIVKQVAITPDFLDAEISEMKDKKKTYKISVTLKDNAPVGRFTGDLKIFTSSKNEPVIDVPVYGMVKEG